MFSADARPADEGRSYFSRKGGGNLIGDELPETTFTSIPIRDIRLRRPGPFDKEGLPIKRSEWIERGVLTNLYYTRFWAQRQDKPPMAAPLNAIMDGGRSTPEQLLEGVERGLLVTRFGDIRMLDPQAILPT